MYTSRPVFQKALVVVFVLGLKFAVLTAFVYGFADVLRQSPFVAFSGALLGFVGFVLGMLCLDRRKVLV